MTKGDYGSGTASGGGGGGSIREAGGKFGEMGAAREEEFFRRIDRERLSLLKHDLESEIKHHEDIIKRHKEKLDDLASKAKNKKQ